MNARPRQRPDSRRGAALMIAIIVLTALMLLAIPFAAFMRRQHAAGTQALHAARAESGQAGGLSHALAALRLGQPGAENSANPFPYNDPNVDTLWEFHVTLRTLISAGSSIGAATVSFAVDDALGLPNDGDPQTVDGYIRVDAEWMAYSNVTWAVPPTSTSATLALHDDPSTPGVDGRGLFGTLQTDHAAGSIVSFFPSAELWNLDVEDPQSKININSAPYRVIRNLLGYLGIGGNSPEDPTTGDPDVDFPSTDQMAIAAAIYNYRVDPATFQPRAFASIDAVRNAIALTADEFDLLRAHATVNSGYAVGADSWVSSGYLESDIASGGFPTDDPSDPSGNTTSRYVANLSDASRVGVGSMVWLSWTDTSVAPPVNYVEYRTVLAKNGCGRPLELAQDCAAGDLSIVLRWAPGFVGASASTPCYVKMDDEWIHYTDVSVDNEADPTTLTVTVPPGGRGQFGTADALHLRGLAYVDGDVICWENTLAAADDPPPLIAALSADCLVSDAPVIQVQNRHGVNVNTCTDAVVLQSLFYDIDAYGASPLGTTEVDRIVTETAPTSGPPGLLPRLAGADRDFFNGNEDWFDGDTDGDGIRDVTIPAELEDFFLSMDTPLSTAQEGMLAHNVSVLTVPLQFNSGALLGLGALAVADDKAGTPVAQAPSEAQLARLFDVVPPLNESIWQWRSQKEFYEHILANSAGRNVLTMPLNEGLLPPDPADPAYPLYAYIGPDTGTVTAALDELRPTVFTTLLEGLHGTPPDFSPDYSVAADSRVTASAPPNFDNTRDGGIGGVHLQYPTDYASPARQRHIEADSFHATIQPIAIEFWVKADTGVIADIGEGAVPGPAPENARNQLRLYLESGTLVLRLDDEIYDDTAPFTYGGYVEARSSPGFTFDAAEWHHVVVAVCGTFRNEIAMFIDGIYDQNMEWTYHYATAPGTGSANQLTVTEGYFWPLAMQMPNQQYLLAAPALPGDTDITLNGATGLPQGTGGRLVIGSASYDYGYVSADASTYVVTLDTPLNEFHNPLEPVAFMIPAVRPMIHKDPTLAPAINDEIGLWGHTDLGNGSFDSKDANAVIGPYTVQNVVGAGGYTWLGIDPSLFPLGGTAGTFAENERWHVFDYDDFIASPSGALSGRLPSGDLGANFSIGADRNGLLGLNGTMDEFRLTTLPTALVQGPETLGGGSSPTLREWEWYANTVVDPAGWPCVRVRDGASAPWLWAGTSPSALHWSGGYFVGADTGVYSYQSYNSGTGALAGTQRVRPDLSAGAGTAAVAAGLWRVMPLNFITSTQLIRDFPDSSLPIEERANIRVVDASQFPPEGYVKIGDEIIGYSGKGVDPDTGEPALFRRAYCDGAANYSAYPRGAYGTTIPALAHAAGAIVRHLPVRHPDRYREEDPASPGPWTQHVNYTEAQLDGQMCMVSFPIDRAGKLKKVSWEFKNALEDGQKVAVLVRIDDPVNVGWNANPYDDDPEDVLVFGSQNDSTSKDLLWGTISADPDGSGELTVYKWIDPSAGTYGYPTATSKVEVRFYFDLGDTHPYGYSYSGGVPTADGWQNMVEIDKVQIEMEAESGSY